MACLTILINDTMHCYVTRNFRYILEVAWFNNARGPNSTRRKQHENIKCLLLLK
jgi:hypothetical protein